MALIVGFVVAVALTPVAAVAARRWGVVDHPGPLKVHERPVPYLGGVAVCAALVVPVALTRPALLVPLGLSLALGLADDVADLPAPLRLAVEVVIGVAVGWAVPGRGAAGALLTVVAVVALINALNLLDGLDGLASGAGAVSAAGFAVVLDGDERALALGLAGALAGFLVWNRPPARIYLGDAGSYLVGTALAALLATAWGEQEPAAVAAGALLFVAVPIADTTVAIVRRIRARRPLFQGDRGHVYDQLVDRGWSPVAATGSLVGAQAVFVVVGLVATTLGTAAAFAVVGVTVVAVGVTALGAFTSPRSWPT